MVITREDTMLEEKHGEGHASHPLLYRAQEHTALLDDFDTPRVHNPAPHFMDSLGKLRSSFPIGNLLDDSRN